MPSKIHKLKHHVFVCTNERPTDHPRGCCKGKNSEVLIQLFKNEISKSGLSSLVRAQRAGCLDLCEEGPVVVVYPEGIWYGRVAESDISEIVRSHLVEGKPVERLRIQGK